MGILHCTHIHIAKVFTALGRVTMFGDGERECTLFDTIIMMNTPVGNIDIVLFLRMGLFTLLASFLRSKWDQVH